MLTLKRYAQFAYSSAKCEMGYLNHTDSVSGFSWFTPQLASVETGMPTIIPITEYRIPGEYRHTGRPGPYRCHDCLNHQLKAEYLVSDFDYRPVPGLEQISEFSLSQLYSRVYPKYTHARPLNGKYYRGSEQRARVIGISPYNVVGSCTTVPGIRGNYAPVFSGLLPSGFVSYFYEGYGVTAVTGRIVIPFFACGRLLKLVQRLSAKVDDSGNLRGSISKYASVSCFSAAGDVSYNGTRWSSGGTLPSAWLGSPSLTDFWRFIANPTEDFFGIIPKIVSSAGLPAGVPDLYRLDCLAATRSIRSLLQFLSSRLPVCGSEKPVVQESDWSDICDTAIDNCHTVDINGIAFLGDFLRLARSIIAIVHGDLTKVPGTLEDLWLSVRYGLTLTFRDLREVGNAVCNQWPEAGALAGPMRTRARTVVPYLPVDPYIRGAMQYRSVEVLYRNNDDRTLSTIRKLMDWDVWPTLQNDWDLIPFSFVVDWVADLEKCCEHIDRRIYEEYIRIDNVLYTTKDSQVFEPSTMNFGGFKCLSCEYVSYVRHQAPYLVFAPLRVQRGHSAAINMVDGAALVIQLTK